LLCGVVIVDTQTNPGVCIFVFKGEYKQVSLKYSKEGTLEWVPISKVTNLQLVSDLPLLLPKVLTSKKGAQLFYAHSTYDQHGNLNLTFV
jgi:8-oxo-dGTP diphosphatase